MIKQFFRQNIVNLLIICPSMILIIVLQKSLLGQNDQLTSADYVRENDLRKTKLDLLIKMPRLGFDNLVSNWAFLDFIQYYGDVEARQVTGYELLPQYFQAVVKKDPRFVNSYLYLDTATTLFAGRPDVSVDLLNYGLNYLSPAYPLAYQLWTYKGTNELLFLGETQKAKQSFQTGAKWAREQNTEDSMVIAQRLEEMAEFLAKNPDSRNARIGSWFMIFSNAREDVVRNLALKNIEELGGKITITEDRISVKVPEEN